LVVELLTPLFPRGTEELPCLASTNDQIAIRTGLANAIGALGRNDEALALYAKLLSIDLENSEWSGVMTHLQNIAVSAGALDRRAERTAALNLALDLAKAAGDHTDVSRAILDQADDAIEQGRFADGNWLLIEFRDRLSQPIEDYQAGGVEYTSSLSQYYQETFSESDWCQGYELARQSRSIFLQSSFLKLRGKWLLTQGQLEPALQAIDEALKLDNRTGTPSPSDHDLRAWALAGLGQAVEARAELANGEQQRFAAEAWRILGDREQARECALNAYKWAWGEGPPYIHWYGLEQSRALLRDLGEPEPELPPFDPAKVKPIPCEQEIRAAIAKLKAK
jgi:tetratricopeptide (TPR) repeat protein